MKTLSTRRDIFRDVAGIVAIFAGGLTVTANANASDDDFKNGGRIGRGWQLLGEVSAGGKVDRDEIRVGRANAYTAIRLQVLEAPVEFFNVRIRFRNGETREVDVRQFVKRGGATRVIDLPGERRLIERVVFWYKTARGGRQARVQLWARR